MSAKAEEDIAYEIPVDNVGNPIVMSEAQEKEREKKLLAEMDRQSKVKRERATHQRGRPVEPHQRGRWIWRSHVHAVESRGRDHFGEHGNTVILVLFFRIKLLLP